MRVRDLDLKLYLVGYLAFILVLHFSTVGCTVLKFKDSVVQVQSPGAVATNVPQAAAPVATAPGSAATQITKPRSTVATGAGSQATDERKAGQHAGAAAIGAGSTASATTKTGLPLLWLVPLVGLVAILLNKLFRGRWLI
jgi:hypothetical protein